MSFLPKISIALTLKGMLIFSDFHPEFIPTTEGGREGQEVDENHEKDSFPVLCNGSPNFYILILSNCA
jgi:hypothetical protein